MNRLSLTSPVSKEVQRFRQLLQNGQLVHPWLPASAELEDDIVVANFTDLSSVLADCCGCDREQLSSHESATMDKKSAKDYICDTLEGKNRKHIVFVLCDGMGLNVLRQHLSKEDSVGSLSSSFLVKNQVHNVKLRAVFPSTTPAALTTFATAVWPGKHGIVGWDLREQVGGCEYPGEERKKSIQLRILAPRIEDYARDSDEGCQHCGGASRYYPSMNDVFIAKPWAEEVLTYNQFIGESALMEDTMASHQRKLIYVNAYNGTADSRPTEFSQWQTGNMRNDFRESSDGRSAKSLLEIISVSETAYATLGTPEGASDAVNFFAHGLDATFNSLEREQKEGCSTFCYIYTAHPDKHMHALGVESAAVKQVVMGIDQELERFWSRLVESNLAKDTTLVVTADHGHITVDPDEMVRLPLDIEECLEYANVGVHGKGRQAYLHCRAGLQSTLRERWRQNSSLKSLFLLLTIEEAIQEGLFGPVQENEDDRATLSGGMIAPKIRPRMGDFVAIALTKATLVSPSECTNVKRGSHGSLLPEEMEIPFVVCKG